MRPLPEIVDMQQVADVLEIRDDLVRELLETGSVTVRFDHQDLVIALYGDLR